MIRRHRHQFQERKTKGCETAISMVASEEERNFGDMKMCLEQRESTSGRTTGMNLCLGRS